MKAPRKESTLERRLRELQEQSSSLQGEIKSLNRSLKKIGAVDEGGRIALAPPPDAGNRTSRLNPNYAASVGSSTTTSVAVTSHETQPAGDEAEVNIFTAAPPQMDEAKPDPIFPPTVSESAAPPPRYRRVATPPKPKLASYLSSGSFGGNVPLSHERKVQRFRAILAVVAAATFVYIIYRSVFR